MLRNAPALLAPVAKGVVQLENPEWVANPKTTPEEQGPGGVCQRGRSSSSRKRFPLWYATEVFCSAPPLLSW
jgi:hypothetical protein